LNKSIKSIGLTDAELLALLKANDATAYRTLVGRFGPFVYNTVLGILQHPGDAEDISQEVFVQIFQSVHQFKGESKLSTWMYRIAVTKSLELLRSRKRKKRFAYVQSLFEQGNNRLAIDPPHFQHPGVLMEQQEHAHYLFQAIEQLPEKQKTAFVLHKLEDLSYAEIAEIMEVSLSAVESLMFRAKQQLRKILGPYYQENAS
jgi:RNA polymerase sigma-70 factor (ECF subfamily)